MERLKVLKRGVSRVGWRRRLAFVNFWRKVEKVMRCVVRMLDSRKWQVLILHRELRERFRCGCRGGFGAGLCFLARDSLKNE